MNTYGKVYKNMIDNGLEAIMAGHIMQPAWTRAINPDIKDEDIMPATLSPELLQGLLREKLGFNGMILTDASHMVGLTCMMKRKDVLPHAIAAGCDMFLFFNDMDEDFGYMMDGYRNGIITEERLQEALERILGLKAHMGLHKKAPTEIMPPKENVHQVVGCSEHKAMAREVAEKSVTLVKNKQDVFPLTPEKYKRITIVPVKGASGGGIFSMLKGGKGPTTAEKVKERLEARGFEVTIYEDPLTKLQRDMAAEAAKAAAEGKTQSEQEAGAAAMKAMMVYFAGKTPIADFVAKQDLVLTLSEVNGTGQTAERVSWAMSKGGGEIPWYVHELPVVVASVGHPFLLADVPQAQTYINAYDAKNDTLDALVEKLCGESEFEGVDPVDAFCGMWDTHM
jgi:beta-N-acetylhexosaminidase